MSTRRDREMIERFERLREQIMLATDIPVFESDKERLLRKKKLLGDYKLFAEYYFPHLCHAETGKFQVKGAKDVLRIPNKTHLWQWSREFAKSVHGNIILPCYLKALGELTGMITGGASEDNSIIRMSDLQAEFETNQRFLIDFGHQQLIGSWESGNFACKDGTFFRAYGRAQSPRGVRHRGNRPNYGTIDDIDDKKLVKNEKLSRETYEWVREDFMGALSIKKWWLLVLENKFHKNTVTARFENDPEMKVHLHRVNMLNGKGESNWPENFTTEECEAKIISLGPNSSQREYFNNPIEEGTVFKEEWFVWKKMLSYKQYDYLITYTDPSYKNTAQSDFKACILIGKKGLEYHVLKAFVDRVSIREMFDWMYMIDDMVGQDTVVLHYMEDAFLQDLMWGELQALARDKGRVLPVVHDRRSKPDKFQRIEAMQPLVQRGILCFNIKEKEAPGMIRLASQFLAFEKGSKVNDDGPDAVEGGIFILNEKTHKAAAPITGRRAANNKRF